MREKNNKLAKAEPKQKSYLIPLLGLAAVSAGELLFVHGDAFLWTGTEEGWLRTILRFTATILEVIFGYINTIRLYSAWYYRNDMEETGRRNMTFPKAMKTLPFLTILVVLWVLIVSMVPKENAWYLAAGWGVRVFLLGLGGAIFLRFFVELFMAWDNHDDRKARQNKKRKKWKPLEMQVSDLQKIFMICEIFEIYINVDGKVYKLWFSCEYDGKIKKKTESFLWHIDDNEYYSAQDMFSSPVINGKALNDCNTIHVIDIDGVDPRGFNIDRMYDERIKM